MSFRWAIVCNQFCSCLMMSPCRTLLSKSFHLAENSPATEANRYGPFGRLCTRVVWHLLGKEKMGREPQLKDETLESFGERFCRELMGHEAEARQQSQSEDSQASAVVDVRNMRAVDTALLQNQHMQLEEWYLDRIIWNCIKKACETICIEILLYILLMFFQLFAPSGTLAAKSMVPSSFSLWRPRTNTWFWCISLGLQILSLSMWNLQI